MTIADAFRSSRLKLAAAAFLLWAAFLISLDPSVFILRFEAGAGGSFGEEVRRVLLASTLGSMVALVQIDLVKRFPMVGERKVASLAIHVSACLGLSVAMIVFAHIFAPLVLAPGNPRLAETLGQQFSKDVLLIALVLGIFTLGLHLAHQRQLLGQEKAHPTFVDRVSVPTRAGITVVDTAAIDWIEAQGNYAALHTGRETHLVRETLTRLCARLDPRSFARIHRGAIVNIARVRRMKPLASGDALVELADGTELRASRTYAGQLREEFRNDLPQSAAGSGERS